MGIYLKLSGPRYLFLTSILSFLVDLNYLEGRSINLRTYLFIKINGYTSKFSRHFSKGANYHDFLFAFLMIKLY